MAAKDPRGNLAKLLPSSRKRNFLNPTRKKFGGFTGVLRND